MLGEGGKEMSKLYLPTRISPFKSFKNAFGHGKNMSWDDFIIYEVKRVASVKKKSEFVIKREEVGEK